jgi:undecaprenyl-diphosphatase
VNRGDAAATAGPSVRRLVGIGAPLAVALIATTGWVLASHLHPTAWDQALHDAGLHHRTPWLTAVAVAVSVTSEYVAYVLAAIGAMLALRPRTWWFGALAGLLLLAVGQGIRVALAAAVGRSRPPHADWEMHAAGFSFPSGHTATATLAAGILCVGLVHCVHSRWRSVGIAVLCLWVLFEGCGRVYLGVHWPTDVLSGWLLGALLTVLVAVLCGQLRTSRFGRAERPDPASSRSLEEQAPGADTPTVGGVARP